MTLLDWPIILLCAGIALCLPVLVYASYKLLPLAYNGLNKTLQRIYGRVFWRIDQIALYWEQAPEDRQAWKEAMQRFKESEKRGS